MFSIKKIVSALCFLACGAVAASASTTITEDLLSRLATGTGQFSSKGNAFNSLANVLNADNIASWLSDDAGQYMRWTCINGSTSYSVAPTLNTTDDGYTLKITNRQSNTGSVAGFSYTLSDEAISSNYTTSFNLEYIFDTSVCDTTVTGALAIVYKTADGWQIAYSSFDVSVDLLATVSVDNVALTDTSVYVVLTTTTGKSTSTYGTISATATIMMIPEPSSFCLFGGLIVLALISLRRKRKV